MNRRRLISSLGCVAFAALAIIAGVFVLPEAQAQRGGGGWEYAEMRIVGFDAILNNGETAWLLEGPDRLDPIRLENNRQRSETPSIEMIHLNTLGASGWEVVPNGGGTASFLLRRAR